LWYSAGDPLLASDPVLRDRIASIDATAESVLDRKQSLDRSAMMKDAFEQAASAMDRIAWDRAGGHTDLEPRIWLLHHITQQIDPGRPLLEQRDAVEAFFRAARPVIEELAEVTPR